MHSQWEPIMSEPTLAVPQKGPVQVTVRAGLVAADGMSSFNDFTAVVT
jgi:hypothetical protein